MRMPLALHRDDDGIHEIIDIELLCIREKQTKKGCQENLAPFRLSIIVGRLPAIAFSTGATATAATESTAAGTLLHRLRFIDR